MTAATPSTHEDRSKPPLHVAVCRGDLDDVRFLVDSQGVSVDTEDSTGNTALFWAINSGSRDMVDFLTGRGADLTDALCTAVELDQPYLCMYFISRGVKRNVPNTAGHTPVDIAFSTRNYAVLNILLDAGASIDGVFSRGNTAVHCAVMSHDLHLVRRICSMGPDLEARNDYGNTPLHLATIHGLYDIVRHLVIDRNVRLDLQDIDHQTPFTIAVSMVDRDHSEIALLLLNAGYCTTQTDRMRLSLPCRLKDRQLHETMSAIQTITKTPQSLTHLAIFIVRQSLHSRTQKIDALPVPQTLKQLIKLTWC